MSDAPDYLNCIKTWQQGRFIEMNNRRAGKTVLDIEMAKAAQKQGKTVLWVTFDQVGPAETLAKHGALSEDIGTMYLKPRFRDIGEGEG